MTCMTAAAVVDARDALATVRAGIDRLLDADLGAPGNDDLPVKTAWMTY